MLSPPPALEVENCRVVLRTRDRGRPPAGDDEAAVMLLFPFTVFEEVCCEFWRKRDWDWVVLLVKGPAIQEGDLMERDARIFL